MSRTQIVVVCLVLSLLPRAAVASGGLFLDALAPIAVEQNRGLILFTVNGDGTVTADVEITYSGSPETFAWVIPVPETPTLEVVPPSTLRMLDAATAPQILAPLMSDLPEGDDDDDDSSYDDDDGVPLDVEELEQVGPYDPTVLSSDDPDEVIDWLRGNGYLVTEEMEPYLASYVAEGMKFLGLKLAPDAGVADIQPISITWTAAEPTIPLILTGVAAEPEMGIVVFIAGDSTYEPLDHSSLLVDSALLQADPRNGQNNYYPLLSWLADQEGGQAFFTEYSDASADLGSRLNEVWMGTEDAAEAHQYLQDVVDGHGSITRLYARMSGEEMLADAAFGSMNGQATVGNLHDLSGRDPVPADLSVVAPMPCNDTYCGPGGACASTDFPGVDGCVCEDGYAARSIVGPLVGSSITTSTVTCQDTAFDLMASAADLIAANDPCEGYDCGAGSCVVLGGMAACDCDEGMAGIPQAGQTTCVAAQEVYGPDQLLWPGWPNPPEPGGDDDDGGLDQATAAGLAEGCGCGASVGGSGGATLLLLLLPALLRRRR